MEKQLHNRIAESQLTIYVCAIFSIVTWIVAGLLTKQLWIQLASMFITCYLMIEMSRHLILLRIRSWMVTSTFMMLTACCGFTYPSISTGILSLCAAFSMFMLFLTYQNPTDVGHTYYAYLSLGVASLFLVQTIYVFPLIWVLSRFLLQTFNWRTWVISLLGLITPYWFALPWFIYQQDYDSIIAHFQPLVEFQRPEEGLQPIQLVFFAFVGLLTIIGAIHFWRESYKERIRTRQLYTFILWTGLAVSLVIILQPQHYNTLIRVVLVCLCPFIAHFFTLSQSKITKYLFFGVLAIVILLSFITINESLLNSTNTFLSQLWNG